MNNVVWIVVAAAVLVLVIGRRLAGEPIRANRVAVLPLVLAVVGLYQVAQAPHLSSFDIGAIAVEGVVAVGLGLLRGSTVRVYVRDGHLWQKYTWATIGVWIGSILVRFAMVGGAVLLGADRSVMQTAILLTLGLTFAGEGAVIALRGRALGAPYAPRGPKRARISS